MESPLQFTSTTSYTVATPVFEGPLDLLLQLIERSELDITKLALAEVTNPFLAYVRQLQSHQGEEVSSFLVVAARLMQIKSEALLPRPPEREPGEEDPGDELVRQLIIYKRYKEIAGILGEREEAGYRTYLRLVPPPKVESKLDMSGITIQDLVKAAERIFTIANDQQPLSTVVKAPSLTIKDKIKQITWTLNNIRRASFQKLLGEKYSRADVVVTFLALLELVKSYRVRASQEAPFGEIEIEAEEDWDSEDEMELAFIE